MRSLELRIPPVVQVAVIAAAMWALARALPALDLPVAPAPVLAVVVVALGVLIAVLGVVEFRKVRTTVDPRYPEKSSRLVVSGVFRFSRNPMYLGFLLVLLGWGLYLMHSLAFLLLPVFVLYMNRFQIQPEERVMSEKFGAQFDAYAASVRRWIRITGGGS